jgi:ribosomal protein L35
MNELQSTYDEALLLFIDGTLTNTDICTNLNIEPKLLTKWIKENQWEEQRDEAEAQIISRANSQFKKHIAKNRSETAKRHLRVASLIEKQIEDRIAESKAPMGSSPLAGIPISTRELKDMAQALKLSADTSARAVVLTERQSEYATEFGKKADGVKRLINVNIMPLAANKPIAIDITEEVSVKKITQDATSEDPF